jgi:hypothetical protein
LPVGNGQYVKKTFKKDNDGLLGRKKRTQEIKSPLEVFKKAVFKAGLKAGTVYPRHGETYEFTVGAAASRPI